MWEALHVPHPAAVCCVWHQGQASRGQDRQGAEQGHPQLASWGTVPVPQVPQMLWVPHQVSEMSDVVPGVLPGLWHE